MFSAMHASDLGIVTRTSIWNLYPLRAPLVEHLRDGAVTQLALVAMAIAIIVVSFGRGNLAHRVTGSVAAWLVLSAYVMPWYTVWALPLAARDPEQPLTRVVAWQGAIVTSAFLFPHRMLTNWFVSFPLGWIASIVLVVAYVRAVRATPRGEPISVPAARPISSPASDLETS
jgi:hypothetical protein